MNKDKYTSDKVDTLHMENCIIISDLIITVGISGSGKSHISKKICQKSKFKEINIDTYRKNITGDINNLSQDELIFEIAYNDLITSLKNSERVIWSNTSCNLKYLEELLGKIRKDASDVTISLLFLEDSFDIDLCRSRIKEDIKNGKIRGNVSREILFKQQNGYKSVGNAFLSYCSDSNDIECENLSDKYYVNTFSIKTDRFDKIYENL